jgi:hypothetical protein
VHTPENPVWPPVPSFKWDWASVTSDCLGAFLYSHLFPNLHLILNREPISEAAIFQIIPIMQPKTI